MKLPTTINYTDTDSGEVLSCEVSQVIKQIVKDYKVKAIGDKSPSDIVKDILTMAFRAKEEFEVPEGLEHLETMKDHCVELAKDHREILESENEKEKQVKALKQQEKQFAKEAKEKEEKEYTENNQRFSELFEKKAKTFIEKAYKNVEATMKGISMPKTITFSGNGMGVEIGDATTKEDLALACATMISASEGNAAMASAMQFVIGDLVNASVAKKIFRNKGDACNQVKFLIETKLNKKFSAGGVNANSLMAERVPASKRVLGVLPSLYYKASKLLPPRNKSITGEAAEKLALAYDAERDNVIDLINNGTISSVKEYDEYEKKVHEKAGIVKSSPNEARNAIARYRARLAWAVWAKDTLVVDGQVRFHAPGTDATSPPTVYTVGDLTDIIEEAKNGLQNLLLQGKDIADLIAGFKEEIIEDKKVKVPFFLDDPFDDTPKEKAKPAEKAPEPTPEPQAEEEEEDEEIEEDENEDEDEDADI